MLQLAQLDEQVDPLAFCPPYPLVPTKAPLPSVTRKPRKLRLGVSPPELESGLPQSPPWLQVLPPCIWAHALVHPPVSCAVSAYAQSSSTPHLHAAQRMICWVVPEYLPSTAAK